MKNKSIINKLKKERSKNPFEIFTSLVGDKKIPMHGPIHHFIDGAVLLTAIYNAKCDVFNIKDFDLTNALEELYERAETMPGATCGNWGMCGSASSIGAAFSILDNTGPLSNDKYYKNHMKLVSKILDNISKIGGPRCCKRNAFIAINTATKFLKEKYGIELETSEIKCQFSDVNMQCKKEKCPFYWHL